jgi:hypothetical protein
MNAYLAFRIASKITQQMTLGVARYTIGLPLHLANVTVSATDVEDFRPATRRTIRALFASIYYAIAVTCFAIALTRGSGPWFWDAYLGFSLAFALICILMLARNFLIFAPHRLQRWLSGIRRECEEEIAARRR